MQHQKIKVQMPVNKQINKSEIKHFAEDPLKIPHGPLGVPGPYFGNPCYTQLNTHRAFVYAGIWVSFNYVVYF